MLSDLKQKAKQMDAEHGISGNKENPKPKEKEKSKPKKSNLEEAKPQKKSTLETGKGLEEAVSVGKRKNKFKLLFDMYWYMLQYYLDKGKNLSKMRLDESSMQVEYDRIFTKENTRCVWTIRQTDKHLPLHFFGDLKAHLDASIPGCRVNILLVPSGHYSVDFSNRDVRYRIDTWERMSSLADETEQTMTAGQALKEEVSRQKSREGMRRMFNSFKKFKKYMASGSRFGKFYVAIEGITSNIETDTGKISDIEMMQRFEECLKDYAQGDGVVFEKVVRRLPEYLEAFSITTLRPNKFRKVLNEVILCDLDIAELDAYTQGTVGDKIGVYMGNDVKTDLPLYLNFTASTKAQNILITALTGGGKSFFIKCLLLFHALCKHRLAIMDYEGKEYYKLVQWLKGVSVSMTVQDSTFVNTLKIGDCSKLPQKEAETRFQESVNATERIFTILANLNDVEIDDIQILFSDLINYLHQSVGVFKNNKATYIGADSLNFFKLYDVLDNFCREPSFIEKHGQIALTVKKRLEPYWSKFGTKRYLFEKEIDIDDILSSRILHFNFGMQNSTDDSAPPKETLLKISMMTYVFAKYHTYNLKNGMFTVNLMEEFQRSGNSPELLRTVNHWITGGRKSNIVNYLVTNSVASLLQNENPNAIAIRENITTYIIGKCRNKTRMQLVEAFDFEDFKPVIDDLSVNPNYENCFIVIFDTGKIRNSVITMMKIHPSFVDNEYFKTRRVELYSETDI